MDSQKVAFELGELTEEDMLRDRIRKLEADLQAERLQNEELQKKLNGVDPLVQLFQRVPRRTRSG